MTDPTFDAPGDYHVPGGKLTKTAPSSAEPAVLGRIDVVLLSHDEHPDNLDNSGRALLADVPLTLTTPGAGSAWGTGPRAWPTGSRSNWTAPAAARSLSRACPPSTGPAHARTSNRSPARSSDSS
ncbi:hypothetical protein ACFQYP_17480 [Nonomuraea antimicrobica]